MYVTGLSAVKLLDYVDMEFWTLVWSMTNIPKNCFINFKRDYIPIPLIWFFFSILTWTNLAFGNCRFQILGEWRSYKLRKTIAWTGSESNKRKSNIDDIIWVGDMCIKVMDVCYEYGETTCVHDTCWTAYTIRSQVWMYWSNDYSPLFTCIYYLITAQHYIMCLWNKI